MSEKGEARARRGVFPRAPPTREHLRLHMPSANIHRSALPESGPESAAPQAVVPLTVIGGYLGAGKTTVLNHLLRHARARGVAVLVSDPGTMDIDASVIRERAGRTVSLLNGCICCSSGEDMAAALTELRRRRRWAHVLVEASGIADPQEIAQFGHLPGYTLDGVVVVADAESVRWFASSPGVGTHVLQQLLAGDLVVLNKVDLVSPAEKRAVCDWLSELLPAGRIAEASHGRLPPSLLLGLHSPDDSRLGPRPNQDGRGMIRHPHESGYAAWTWTSEEPLDDGAFRWWMSSLPYGILRAKGTVYLLSSPETRFGLQLVGSRWSARRQGGWGRERPRTVLLLVGRVGSFDPGWLDGTLRQCVARH
jgi:G3E family GTPase